jgi:hypothetical protein
MSLSLFKFLSSSDYIYFQFLNAHTTTAFGRLVLVVPLFSLHDLVLIMIFVHASTITTSGIHDQKKCPSEILYQESSQYLSLTGLDIVLCKSDSFKRNFRAFGFVHVHCRYYQAIILLVTTEPSISLVSAVY